MKLFQCKKGLRVYYKDINGKKWPAVIDSFYEWHENPNSEVCVRFIGSRSKGTLPNRCYDYYHQNDILGGKGKVYYCFYENYGDHEENLINLYPARKPKPLTYGQAIKILEAQNK